MWDKMVQNDMMCRNVQYVVGLGGLLMPQVGPPGYFFVKISFDKGILGQF